MKQDSAPILLSVRLRLRPHVRGVYLSSRTLWQHPETIRFIGGAVRSDQDIWFRLLRYGGMWPMQGYGFWVLDWADARVSADRTGCIIDPGNAASLRVATKLGYVEVGRPGFRGEPIVLLHRSRRSAS